MIETVVFQFPETAVDDHFGNILGVQEAYMKVFLNTLRDTPDRNE